MTSTVVAWDIALYHPAPRAGSGQNSLRVFEGVTTGTSIGLLIENTDSALRITAQLKTFSAQAMLITLRTKIRSARLSRRWTFFRPQTAMRVAAGAIAKKYLAEKFVLKSAAA